MKTFAGTITLVFLTVLLGGCDDSGQREEQAAAAARAAEEKLKTGAEKAEGIIRNLSQAVEQLNNDVATVSKDELKKMLPVEVPGMERTSYSASRRGIEGFSFTHVESEFTADDGDGSLVLSITDIGNVSGFAALGLEVLDVEIDEENQDGFKRSGSYKGFKSFQKHASRNARSDSEILVFIEGRFIAKAQARNVEWDLVATVFDSIPIETLPDMID
ncbi:MAG: hypothetical protein HKN70_10680 [Gammaproteobacteria bacterium]|nr:hypothetical protein [Gammaproteobacteria bacterium]